MVDTTSGRIIVSAVLFILPFGLLTYQAQELNREQKLNSTFQMVLTMLSMQA